MKKTMLLVCMLGLSVPMFAQNIIMPRPKENLDKIYPEIARLKGTIERAVTRNYTIKVVPLPKEDATQIMLTAAAYSQWENVIELLEQTDADAMAVDDGGNSVLMFAAEAGQKNVVNYLLVRKKLTAQHINTPNKAGETALSLTENSEIIDLLISYGALMECGD